MIQVILSLMWSMLTTWTELDSILVGFIIAITFGIVIGRLLQKRIWRIYDYK